MAYPNKCKAVGGFDCTRVNWFSSPTVKAQPGNVTIGVAQNEAGAADNTRRLKETAVLAASYTPWPVTASAQSIPTVPGATGSDAMGVSADGSVVVGSFSSSGRAGVSLDQSGGHGRSGSSAGWQPRALPPA